MAVFSFKLYVFLTVSLRAWQSLAYYQPATNQESFHFNDRMGWHEKRKLMFLCKDLFKECLLKMRQIIDIRDEHDTLIAFNVGMIMGRIREKYRFMMETYRDIIDSFYDRHWAKPPGYMTLRPIHIVMALEMMHYLEIEIDKLIDVLIDEGTGDLNSMRTIIGQTEPRAWWKEDEGKNSTNQTARGPDPITAAEGTKPVPLMPLGPGQAKQLQDAENPEPEKPPGRKRVRSNIQQEEREKSMLRQQFLMRKLGMSLNMTTMKKRFLRHWPVEESWALDKYNYDYK